jgi:hypothetical protein
MEILATQIFLVLLILALLLNIFSFSGPAIILGAAFLYGLVTWFETTSVALMAVLFLIVVLSAGVDWFFTQAGAAFFPLSQKSLGLMLVMGTAGALILTPFFYGPGLLGGAFLGGLFGVFSLELATMQKFRPIFRNYRALILGGTMVFCRGLLSFTMLLLLLNNIYS